MNTYYEVGSILECIGKGDNVLNMTRVAQTQRSTINRWDLPKWKSFCKTKQQSTKCEKIFTNPTSDRGLVKIYKKIQET